MKRYAKNPAELVIQNPTPKKKKKMGKSKRKRDSKGRFMSKKKRKKRSNPSVQDEFVDTGKNLFLQYGLAALAATGTVKGAQYLLDKIPNIPQWAKEWSMIGGPAVAGIVLSMYSNPNSAIAQGVAGGMVLASANGLSDKLIKGIEPGKSQMADAQLQKGDMIVKADGILYDQQGNPIARISGNGETKTIAPSSHTSFDEENKHLLGDSAGFGVDAMSWEGGEAFTA